jgi:putative SOS response-associated peptidase YedK
MCGRVIQSSGPLRYAIVDGMNVRDSRVHNYPPRWNAGPSQELLVIRRNHKTGEASLDPLRWGLIPYWCNDPNGGRKPINAKFETVRDLPTFREAYRKRRCLRMWPISTRVNKPENDDPSIVEPIRLETDAA